MRWTGDTEAFVDWAADGRTSTEDLVSGLETIEDEGAIPDVVAALESRLEEERAAHSGQTVAVLPDHGDPEEREGTDEDDKERFDLLDAKLAAIHKWRQERISGLR